MPDTRISMYVHYQSTGTYIASYNKFSEKWDVGSSVEEALLNCINTNHQEFGLSQGDITESSTNIEGHRIGSRAALRQTINLLKQRGVEVKIEFQVI